ncbi:MAG: tRNA (adenosine(37)-N6)-dimethylallyltransferase MiaA, partial [Proteobacteria bacterium]|nr:tRNA (adenosine(37)-N6)-dimethylallyltransferase MiaA [Pseudomonadota bacterium]
IGTAKAGEEDRRRVRHHLLDIRDPDQAFSVGRFIPLFRETVATVADEGDLPVAVGGTGLYLRGGLGGLFDGPGRDEALRADLKSQEDSRPGTLFQLLGKEDPATAERTMPNDLVRIIRAIEVLRLTGRSISEFQRGHAFTDRPFDSLIFCLDPPRDLLYSWISDRVDQMIRDGFLEEVRRLKEKGYGRDLTSMKALGYRELMAHLDGEMTFAEAVERIKRNTRHYAKRQITWFRREKGATWLEYQSRDQIPGLAEKIIKTVQSLP